MRLLILILGVFVLSACGVKGDPLPPEKPAELGRGRPTYRRAMKDIKVAPVLDEDDDESEKSNEDEE